VMQHHFFTISPDASIAELVRALRDHDVGGMPVVEAAGQLVGTVSSTDLLWLAEATAEVDDRTAPFLSLTALKERTVRDVMTPDALGVGPEASMAELRRFFARTGVHRALVIDGRRLVGIVALSDALAAVVS
jgi:CBS-domain-containing membrane protein